MISPFEWPSQVRAALQAWAERIVPADLFDVEEADDEAEEG